MNILFDLDGTLVDSRAGILASNRYALERLDRPIPPRRRATKMDWATTQLQLCPPFWSA